MEARTQFTDYPQVSKYAPVLPECAQCCLHPITTTSSHQKHHVGAILMNLEELTENSWMVNRPVLLSSDGKLKALSPCACQNKDEAKLPEIPQWTDFSWSSSSLVHNRVNLYTSFQGNIKSCYHIPITSYPCIFKTSVHWFPSSPSLHFTSQRPFFLFSNLKKRLKEKIQKFYS